MIILLSAQEEQELGWVGLVLHHQKSLMTGLLACRIEPQRLPHLIEAEAEDLVQRIGDAWGKVANMPPGADRFEICTVKCL